MPVHVVLHHEVEGPERRDERAGDAEHHGHAEEQHHSRVLLAEPELVADGMLKKMERQVFGLELPETIPRCLNQLVLHRSPSPILSRQ